MMRRAPILLWSMMHPVWNPLINLFVIAREYLIGLPDWRPTALNCPFDSHRPMDPGFFVKVGREVGIDVTVIVVRERGAGGVEIAAVAVEGVGVGVEGADALVDGAALNGTVHSPHLRLLHHLKKEIHEIWHLMECL